MEDCLVVFYCEYSQVRARKLSNFFSQIDFERHNGQKWYPNTYVLKGGYNEFFKYYKDATTTRQYVKEDAAGFESRKLELSEHRQYNMNIPESYREAQ